MKLAPIIWDGCRRPDFSIDLAQAARQTGCKVTEGADNYLSFVEAIRPVRSRQVAALTIATAMALYPPDAAAQPEEGK